MGIQLWYSISTYMSRVELSSIDKKKKHQELYGRRDWYANHCEQWMKGRSASFCVTLCPLWETQASPQQRHRTNWAPDKSSFPYMQLRAFAKIPGALWRLRPNIQSSYYLFEWRCKCWPIRNSRNIKFIKLAGVRMSLRINETHYILAIIKAWSEFRLK